MANRRSTFYASSSNLHRKQRIWTWKDAVEALSADFNAIEKDRGASVNSVVWESDSTSVVSVAGASLSAGIAEVDATAASAGTANVSCVATLDDSSKIVVWWEIVVRDAG